MKIFFVFIGLLLGAVNCSAFVVPTSVKHPNASLLWKKSMAAIGNQFSHPTGSVSAARALESAAEDLIPDSQTLAEVRFYHR